MCRKNIKSLIKCSVWDNRLTLYSLMDTSGRPDTAIQRTMSLDALNSYIFYNFSIFFSCFTAIYNIEFFFSILKL